MISAVSHRLPFSLYLYPRSVTGGALHILHLAGGIAVTGVSATTAHRAQVRLDRLVHDFDCRVDLFDLGINLSTLPVTLFFNAAFLLYQVPPFHRKGSNSVVHWPSPFSTSSR